jgi:signal transduction histidine kinase
METMQRAHPPRWPWWILGIVVVLSAVGLALEFSARHVPLPPSWFGPRGFAIPISLAFAVTGALIATRAPDNAIGKILCAASIFTVIQGVAGPYVVWTVGGRQSTALASAIAENLVEWVWVPPIASLGVMFALFPDGRLLSRRWGIWLGVSLVSAGIFLLSLVLISPFEYYPQVHNPLGVPGVTSIGSPFAFGLLSSLAIGLASVVVRFRRATGEQREQLKWLTLAAAFLVATFGLYLFTLAGEWVLSPSRSIAEIDALPLIHAYTWLMVLAILIIPVSIAIAILRYRLYDVDLVIRKTVVFGVLVVLMTAAFLLVAAAVGVFVAGSAAGLRVALAFSLGAFIGPFRRLAERIADRWVFGGRATPYEVLAEFSRRAAGAYTTDDVLPRMAQIAAAGVGADRARVWVRVGRELSVGATTAEGAAPVALDGDILPHLPDDHAEAVFHGGKLLGAIAVTMPPSDPMTPEKERLIGDLAAQAGAVIANATLIEELRASRQRLVTAQDEARRRLERNIHDGAQQQLVALAVKLRLLRQSAERDPSSVAALTDQLQRDANDALENLRDLARGIYPPLLADKGLAPALEAQVRKAALPVELEADPQGIGRYSPEVEATVYFCTLEALNNATKYADARRITIRLSRTNGALTFGVQDDGRGFDATTTSYGTGLQGMADRLDALGGRLHVESAPGSGTRVLGSIPVGV